MTIQEQTKAIFDKYTNIYCNFFNTNPTDYRFIIQCAITEVEACIVTANDSIAFKQTKRDRLNDILKHLKQM